MAESPELLFANQQDKIEHDALVSKYSCVFEPNLTGGTRVWFDLSDVILFLSQHTHVTGIQRVVIKLFEQFHKNNFSNHDFFFVYVERPSNQIYQIDKYIFNVIRTEIEKEKPNNNYIKYLLHKSQTNKPVILGQNDFFILLGAFWNFPEYYILLSNMKKAGCKIGTLIYDLIPLTHASYFDLSTVDAFRNSILRVLNYCDFAMTISEYVATQTRQLISCELKREMPVFAVPLAQDSIAAEIANYDSIFAAPNTRGKYILCVGTIEARKNHFYLFQIWKRWLEAGRQDIPTLICIGRWGWHFDDFRTSLEDTDYLSGKIEVLSSVSDNELSFLYANCQCTIFPSFAEGWGLPIGESLVYGKPCFASNTTAMPEVGGDFVRYIDPTDVEDGLEKLTAILDRPNELLVWGARIKREFVPRSWTDVASRICHVIAEAASLPIYTQSGIITIPVAVVIPVGKRDMPYTTEQNLQVSVLPLIADLGWQAIETWGRWSSDSAPRLRFAIVGLEATSLLRLALCLKLSKDEDRASLQAISHGLITSFEMPDGRERWYFCSVQSRPDGTVAVELVLKYQQNGLRHRFDQRLGLIEIAVVQQDKVEDRKLMMLNISGT